MSTPYSTSAQFTVCFGSTQQPSSGVLPIVCFDESSGPNLFVDAYFWRNPSFLGFSDDSAFLPLFSGIAFLFSHSQFSGFLSFPNDLVFSYSLSFSGIYGAVLAVLESLICCLDFTPLGCQSSFKIESTSTIVDSSAGTIVTVLFSYLCIFTSSSATTGLVTALEVDAVSSI